MQSSIAASINSVVNQPGSGVASSGIIGAIKSAATKTGVDFSYLLQKASAESGLNATATASTSSATGLFQFTSQTWLQMVKSSGAQYGLGAYAAQIKTDANGHLSVSDPATKNAILALRNDPTVSAEMAGELDKQNAASLQNTVGGKIGGTELYLAHFLGASGAGNFISEMRADPNTTGASVLPTAAAANPSVFYTSSGAPRTLAQIYQHFAQKFDGGSATTQIASATSSTSSSTTSAPVSQAAIATAFAPTLTHIASLYPATTATGSADATPMAGYRAIASGTTATSGASTMFTAMVLGQMNGAGLDPNSALNMLGQSEDKRKSALVNMSAAV